MIQEHQYAGFWRRFAALYLDCVYIAAIQALATIVLVSMFGLSLNMPYSMRTVCEYLSAIIFFLYFVLLESSSNGGTWGKNALGIKVINRENESISIVKACVRNIGKLLSTIPFFIGFLSVAFTKRKRSLHDVLSGTFVVTNDKPYRFRALFFGFLISTTLVVCLMAGLGYIIWRKIDNEHGISAIALDDPSNFSDMAPLKESIKTRSEKPMNLDAQGYQTYIETQLDSVTKGYSTKAGPANLTYSTFFETSGTLWCDIALPVIPNLLLVKDSVGILMENVLSRDGSSLLLADRDFEEESFPHMSLSQENDEVEYLYGIHTMKLIKGTEEKDIATIKGIFSLKLPINIKTIKFRSDEGNVSKTENGVTIFLSGIKGSQVLYSHDDYGEKFLGIHAFNASGDELNGAGHRGGSKGSKKLFKGVVSSVEFLIVDTFSEKHYPFSITVN